MKWSGWLFDNLGLKLFALLLAVLLYLHVLTDRTIEQTIAFPLSFTALPESLALATVPPPRLSVRLRGTGKQVLRLRYLEPPVQLSLADVVPGTWERTLGPSDVPLDGAEGVTVLEVLEPTHLALEIEPRGERRIPVAVRVSGTPLRGYLLAGSPEVRPPSVRLTGPAGWLAAQESIATQPIVVAGRRETLEVMQALVPPPSFARARPGSVLVALRLEPEESRTIRVPVEVRGIRGELRAEPAPAAIAVTWRGPRSVAETLGPESWSARVDAGRKGRGEWRLPVQLSGPGFGGAPAGGLGATAEPESVRVVLH